MKDAKPKVQVWSCGGGTQSCAIAVLIIQGKLPKPDIAVIADTGYETGATWGYFDGVLKPGLAKVGVEIKKVAASEWGYHGNKIVHSTFGPKSEGKHPFTTPMCVYSTAYGSISKTPNLCSTEWKREPIQRYLSKVCGVTRSKYIFWIGFSRDEQGRIMRMQRSVDFAKCLIRFPLLELNVTRRECTKLVEDFGWPTPPRSACWMCPNHSDHEWRKLIAERPDEFQKAVELEREIHLTDPDAWLHRSCIPLDQVDFSQPEDLFSRPCDSGLCFV